MMAHDQQPPRFDNHVRFNWGYHDAVWEYRRNMPNRCAAAHADALYRVGYLYGYAAAETGAACASSAAAWHAALTQGQVVP